MDTIYPLDDVTELRRLQDEARNDLRITFSPRALTSPRLLRQFLESQLPELNFDRSCSSHEMFLIGSQSFERENIHFISTFCGRCRYHFHVTSDSQHTQSYSSDEHRIHMLVPCSQSSADDSGMEETGYDDAIGNTRFICVADDCLFNIKISVVPQRIAQDEVMKFSDKNRVTHNLAQARAEDPDRFADFSVNSTPGSDSILCKYLTDALQQVAGRPPLRINKRNKKFQVCMGDDFDTLLKFLGFYEGVDAESGEPCWFITHPDKERDPTRVRSLRARMEDALAELQLITGDQPVPAWERLLRTFHGDYPNVSVEFNYMTSVPETNFELLGCLAGYPPGFFSWAAILLARLRPRDRDKYLDAGLRCIKERSDDASTEIIMYKSQFDGANPIDIRVQEAYSFFNASPEDGVTSDWFLAKYYGMAKVNSTDDFKAQAQQHLEAIGNYLGRDIVSEIDPKVLDSVGESGLMLSTSDGRRMSISSAAKLLGVEPHYTAEIIRGFVQQLVHEETADRDKLVEAIDVLSELKRQQDLPEEAADLQQIAEFVKETGYAPMLVSQPHASPQPAASVNTPPGLRNIGNTCYLNSLLQYFYNVKVVRDLVLHFDELKLELDEETVGQRRTGGNGTSVNLEEAIVARQFVEMLQGLFADLQATADTAVQPSQKLANTALSSARDILDRQSNIIPPPLPARPSAAPPPPPKNDNGVANGETNNAVQVTVESVNDKLELASSRSSQTLVDESEDTAMSFGTSKPPKDDNVSTVFETNKNDVKMQDSVESSALDEKIAEVSRRLEHSDRSGTSQQDVGEIIGNILEHFMRGIRPDGPMPGKPELQADKITETFFTTIVNYTIKTRKGYPTSEPVTYLQETPLNVEIVPERWITAYPEEADQTTSDSAGPKDVRCTLTAALDRYFSYEPIDDGNRARYSSIRSLPPIVHICIQRSTPKGKNKNPVIIPEILSLDRYMEAEKDSPVWYARKRTWALKERLKELGTRTSKDVQGDLGPSVQSEDADIEELAGMANAASDKFAEDADIQQVLLEDMYTERKRKLPETPDSTVVKKIATPSASVSCPLSDKFGDLVWEASNPLNEMTLNEIVDLRQREETIFDAIMEEKYNIHAVICHRGGTSAGHYWVWIRDFKRNVWYRYNDETVTEDSRGTEAVLNDLNQTGDPYYVAYVRDELKDDLVDVPLRRKSEAEGSLAGGEDVEMIEGVTVEESQVPPTNGRLSD